MEELRPFMPLNEALKYIRTPKFDPHLAPRRYHTISQNLGSNQSIGFRGAVVIYGIRRVGKTVSVIELAKQAQRNGYTVFYTDLDNPLFNPDESMKTGSILRAASYIVKKYKNRKLFLIIDEAFVGSVRVIHKFLETFKPLYDEGRDFGIILLGSYGTDIERLRAYLYRTIPAKGIQPMIIATPLLCVSKGRRKEFDIGLLEALTKPPEHPLRYETMKRLVEAGLYYDGSPGPKAEELLRDYLSHAGMPEAVLGVKGLNELITSFYHLLEESVSRFKSIVSAVKDEKIRYEKITFKNVVRELVELTGNFVSKPPKDSQELKLREFVFNLGLLIPRRYLRDLKKNRGRLLLNVSTSSLGELMEVFESQPVPAHYFAYRIVEYLAKNSDRRLPGGLYAESIVAHALIAHATKRNDDASMARLPIFSAPGIDFLYVFKDVYGTVQAVPIEVKTGEMARRIEEYEYGSRKELDKALETAASLGTPLVVVTDENDVRLGEKALMKDVDGLNVPIYLIPLSLFVAGIGCEKISPASRR